MNILFLNSPDFWLNGWLNTPESLRFAMDTLRTFDIKVTAREINHIKELDALLSDLDRETLIWPNAYYTYGDNQEVVWLQEAIEQLGFPYVGTPVEGLKTMLDKPCTQLKMEQAGVAIPNHLVISRFNFSAFDELVETSDLKWPLVVKPTSESCNTGVIKAESAKQAKDHISSIFDEFPQSDALLETFLPNEDVTCSYLAMGDEILLLPTYYKSLEVSGRSHVVERDLGSGPWGGSSIIMPPVQERIVLAQLHDQIPALVDAIGISGITRVDARLDVEGRLNFFDVNGMPSLSYPKSVLVRQVRECYPTVPDMQAYKYLLKTMVLISANRFGLPAPHQVMEENLFTLDSKYVIRSTAILEH